MTKSGRASTRQELLRTARRLARVRHGVALLRRKREALVAELFRIARPAVDARAEIAARTRTAYQALLPALARLGAEGLRAVGWPTRDLSVEVLAASVWGVPVATVTSHTPVVRTPEARMVAAGGVGDATLAAADSFEKLVDILLEAAPREALLRSLGEALARTSRQVNVLERDLAPALQRDVQAIRQALNERDREDWIRVRILVRRLHRA
jgi:V/A-type H+/Na+-transporting ATPase subunit D